MKYAYARHDAEWSKEIDISKLPQSTINYAIARGLHEALKDTFAGNAVKTGEGIDPQTALQEAIDEFKAGLDKKVQQFLDGKMPEYVPGGRSAGQPRDPRSEMIDRVTSELLRAAAKQVQKKLPKVSSDDYKTMHAKFREANRAAIEAEADKRLKAASKVSVNLDGVF